MFWWKQHRPSVHLIGIGGSGMSGIAEVLLASGFEVSGSDMSETSTTKRLVQLGAQIRIGHNPAHLANPSCVVVSSAVQPENPEWQAANKKNIPVIPRAEMLAELMRLKKGVAVAGSHGKTTTTSLLGQLLRSIDPTVVVGGRLQHWNASSIVGKGSCFVIEADESDRSFLKFNPIYSIVTNIDLEHLDNYSGIEDIKNTFVEFLNRTAFFGRNWVNADCSNIAKIRPLIRKPTSSFGFSDSADLRIVNDRYENARSYFSLVRGGEALSGEFELSVPGRHNVMNATAAIAVALELGVSLGSIKRRLREFIPADRRFQIHFQDESRVVIEDYAHHPTEIQATFEAIRQVYPESEWGLRVLFQPHRYTRTQVLWKEFCQVLKNSRAEGLYILPIYSAHEKAIPEVSSDRLVEQLGDSAQLVSILPDEGKSIYELFESGAKEQNEKSKSVFLIMGAAPLTRVATALSDFFREDSALQRAKD